MQICEEKRITSAVERKDAWLQIEVKERTSHRKNICPKTLIEKKTGVDLHDFLETEGLKDRSLRGTA